MNTPMSQVASLLKPLLLVARLDAAKLILPLLVTFMNSLAANPSGVNRIVQLGALEAGLLAALPHIEQDELQELASLLAGEANSLLAEAQAAAVAKA